jgi:hypothetical protein
MRLSTQLMALVAVALISVLASIYVVGPALSGNAASAVEIKTEFIFLVDAPRQHTVESIKRIEPGTTALDALLTTIPHRSVEYSGRPDGIYVTSINDIRENETHSWHFYINNESAAVSVGDYVPKEGDYLALILEERA